MWTTEIPDGRAKVDLDTGNATFDFSKLDTVFDVFTVPNSFDTAHALGFVSATVARLRIKWSGIRKRYDNFERPSFRGTFRDSVAASIEVTVRTPAAEPPFTPTPQHGFEFTSDPGTAVTLFAQIGQERNGTFR